MARPYAITAGVRPAGRSASARLWVEIAVVYGLLEGALWSYGRAQLIWGVLMLGWAAATTLANGRTRRELGLGRDGLKASAWVVAAAVGLAAVMMAGASAAGTLHTSNMNEAPWRIVLYALWALVQEILAQSYLYLRLETLWGRSRRAVLMTAVLFALAHLPNPVLMPVTFLAALAFTATFRRWHNVYTVAVAHAVLGLALSVTVPATLTHNMRVGIAYWR